MPQVHALQISPQEDVMNAHRSLFFIALLAGCGASVSTPQATDEGKGIASVDISPNETVMDAGKKQQFHATVRYADGTTKDVTNDVVWNSSAPSVAAVSKDGTVVTGNAGIVEITAAYKGAKGTEHFVVK
jgi:hypothetical protein